MSDPIREAAEALLVDLAWLSGDDQREPDYWSAVIKSKNALRAALSSSPPPARTYEQGWIEGVKAGHAQAIGWLEQGWPEHKILALAMGDHFFNRVPEERRTLKEWFKDPAFRAEIDKMLAEMYP